MTLSQSGGGGEQRFHRTERRSTVIDRLNLGGQRQLDTYIESMMSHKGVRARNAESGGLRPSNT